MKNFAALLLAMLTTLTSARAEQPVAAVFTDLEEAVQKLQSATNSEPQMIPLLARIDLDVQALRTKYINHQEMSAAYRKTLQYDLDQLTLARNSTTTPADARAILSDVRTDLDAKLKHARAGSSLGESLGIDTAVVVRTTRRGADINGYDVECNPRRWQDSAAPMFIFDSETTPATKTIPPGYYRFRLLRRGAVVKVFDRSIGLDGQKQQTIVISLD